MAMNLDTAIRLTAQVQGAQNLKGMAAQFQQLNATAQISGRQLDRLYTATQQFSRAAGGSINSLQQQRQALDTLRNAVDPASRRFQLLTRDIDNLDRRLQGLTRTSNAAKRGLSGLNVREILGGAAGAAALGGGPSAAIGALGGSLAAAGTTAGIAAAAGVAATAGLTIQSVASARALEEQARRLRVMTEEGDSLQQQIIALTREQGHLISTTEASAAAYEILQAGFSKGGDILSILKAATLGATAGFTDVKTVADATTSILNGYGLAAAEAGRIVDQMKASTDDGKISMEAYSQSIGQVVPAAAAAKIPLEEVNAAISALTAQGVPVETTFSGINQAIKTILKPTKEASDLAKQLGLEFNAQAVATKGLGGFLADVAVKTGKSTDALSVLFSDIDGYKAVVGLLNDELRRYNQSIDNQANAIGRSADATKKAIDPVKRFDNSWKDFTSTLGMLVLPTLEKVVNNSTKLLQGLLAVSKQLKEVGKWGAWAVNQINPLTPSLVAFDGLSKLTSINQSSAPSRSQQFGPPVPERLRSSVIGGQSDPSAAAARATALAQQLRNGGSVASSTARSEAEAQKAAELQKRRSEALADHQRKIADEIAQEQRRHNLQLFDDRMAMDRQLFDLQVEQVQRQRDFNDRLRKAQYESVIQRAPEEQRPALRFAYEMEQIFKGVTDSLQGIDDELEKARRDLIDAQAGVRRAQMEQQTRTIVTSAGSAAGRVMSAGGIIARTGNTGQSTGPHLDARWADRRPITAADVDRYISVNGRSPSSFGVTSGYGPRNLFGRSFHAGVDFGTPSGSSISLKNGAQMLRDLGNTGAGGYAIEIMTAQGPMRLLHLQAGSAARTAAAPIAPVLPSPSAAAPGDLTTTLPASQAGVMAAQSEVERLQARVRVLEQMRNEAGPQEQRLAGITGQTLSLQRLEEINKSFQDFAKSTGDRLAYEREYAGLLANDVTPELAREFIQLNQITAERSKQLQLQKELFEHQLKNSNITDSQKDIARQGLDLVNQQLTLQQQQVEQVREELRLREQIIEAQRYRQDDRIGRGAIEGVRSYVAEIGTMREATAQLTQQGIRGLEDSLVSLATTGKANWREFTVSVLEGTARMIIQQMVLAPLMRAIGGIGGSIGGGVAQSFQMPPQYFLPAGGFSFEGGGYTGSGARSGGMDGRGGFLAMLHPRETVIDHTKPNAAGGFSFEGGGYTGSGARSGGMDGRGGFLAMLHPRETVIDHTKANAAGGNTTVVVNINTTTGETQTQATDADRRRLGQDIAQVVDARLVYHKRQGGMLSGRR